MKNNLCKKYVGRTIKLNMWVQYLLLISIVFFSNSLVAGELLKEIKFSKKSNAVEISAILGVPFSYVKHFPRKRGKIIQIQIDVNSEDFDKTKLKRRETIKPEAFEGLAVRDVIYEGNVRGGPYLVFRFKSVVDFVVLGNENDHTIRVQVRSDSVAEKPIVKKVIVKNEQSTDSHATRLMRDARAALTKGQNSKAIILFTELLATEDPQFEADALEYLGLSRERNGQLGMAKKEYETYLKQHPKNRRINTVKQRLMTLNARIAKPRKGLKQSKRQLALRQNSSLKRVDLFGRISQIANLDQIKREGSEEKFDTTRKTLLSFFDITRRERDANKETRLVFSGSHETDFKKDAAMEARVRSLYGEYKGKKNGLEFSIGRQTENSGGVLGRFDGAVLGFRIKPKIRGYFVGGFPVDFIDHQQIQTNKPMLGGRVDFDAPIPNWKMSTYAIRQNIGDLVNRAAVGGDIRYFFDKKVFYALVDYDLSYKHLNFVTTHFSWQMGKATKFDVHLDHRSSPIVFTSNALQGVRVQKDEDTKLTFIKVGDTIIQNPAIEVGEIITIDKLLNEGFSETDLRTQAINNTGSNSLATFSVRHTIKKDLDLNATLTVSQYVAGKNQQALEEEREKKSDEEIPKDNSYKPSFDKAISSQIIQRNFFKPRDVIIGGLRFISNTNSTRYEINTTFRTPYKKKWWLDVKTRVMLTTIKTKDNKQAGRVSPRFRAEYRYTKKLSFDAAIGADFNISALENEDYTWVTYSTGFRYLF